MCDKEQLALLRQGVAVWNAWIDEARQRGIGPDLRRAELSNADLTGADLRGANLSLAILRDAILRGAKLSSTDLGAKLSSTDLNEADLSGADLTGADLSGANLIEAILRDANLRDANLSKADLAKADLSYAVLQGANLRDVHYLEDASLEFANLSNADLRDANLSEAYLGQTVFANIDLSTTRGLDDCRHMGPSVVDHRTLQQSGQLPLSFLQGCGLRDWEIEATKLHSQALTHDDIVEIAKEIARIRSEQPNEFYFPFISYSSKDTEFARSVYEYLQGKGVRCWADWADRKTDTRTRDDIDSAIRAQTKLIVVLSENSIDSDWVEDEVETAFEVEADREDRRTVVVPITIDDAVCQTRRAWVTKLRRRAIHDFRSWKDHDAYQSALERLLRDLRVAP